MKSLPTRVAIATAADLAATGELLERFARERAHILALLLAHLDALPDHAPGTLLDLIEESEAEPALRYAEALFEIRFGDRGAAVEVLWGIVRSDSWRNVPRATRFAWIRAALHLSLRRHASTWGTPESLGAADLDRLQVDRSAARNLRRGVPWRRLERVEPLDDADPVESIAAGAVDLDLLLSVAFEALDVTQDDLEAQLVALLAEGDPSEACRQLGIPRAQFRALQARARRARG